MIFTFKLDNLMKHTYEKICIIGLSLLSVITPSACADLPLINPVLVVSFENQIELLEEND